MTLCTAPNSVVVENCCLQLRGDLRPSLPGAQTYCNVGKADQWSTCVNAQGIANSSLVDVVAQGECITGGVGGGIMGAAAGNTPPGARKLGVLVFVVLVAACVVA